MPRAPRRRANASLGALGPRKRPSRSCRSADRGGAAPERASAASPGRRERRRRTALAWLCSAALGAPGQRHADVARRRSRACSRTSSGDLVEPGQAEQLLRLQELDAERALLDEPIGSQPDVAKRRQQQRVEPDREARDEPRERAAAASPPFQKMPPRIAGANCATAANEMSPIETSA